MEEFEKIIKKYLKTLLADLKKCKSKKKYSELVSIYYVIEEMISNMDIDIKLSKEFEYELNKYDIDKYNRAYELMFIDNYDIMYDYNIELSNIHKSINSAYLTPIDYQDYVDISNTISMVQSFLSNYSQEMLNYFNEQIVDDGRLILTDKVESGCTSLSNYIFPPYSFVNPSLNALDYVTIIHETAHNYIRNRLRYINFDQLNTMLVNNLEEVFPVFSELCAIKYAQENNMLKELDKYKDDMYASLYMHLKNYNENLINSDIFDYTTNERYAYGFLLAYQYYNLYSKGNEDIKKKVLNLTLDSPYHDKKYLLNNYGLNQFDLLGSARYLNSIN